MKRKKGKRRQWTRRKKRITAKLDEDGAREMKKKKMDGTKTTTTEAAGWSSSGVAELPLDVWGDIFSRLPLKQVLLCRCICRAWNALLVRIHHPNPTTPAALLYYPYRPMPPHQMHLIELRDGASYVSSVTRYTCRGGADTDDDVNLLWPVASCHGLVCFVRNIDRRRRKNIFVGNPLLKEHLLLVRPSKINMKTKASQWSEVVGFGFSPRDDRYKILRWFNVEQDQSHFLICTVGDGTSSSRCRGKRKRCPPKWRGLLSFPCYFRRRHSRRLGSHLNAGIHWLVSDSDKDNSVFISRLDMDTEQFGRVEVPQSPHFNGAPLQDLSLGVSDGHLIICANLRGQDIIDIWVMNQFNFWTKKLVIRSLIPPGLRVEVLNYGKVEAAAREGSAAEVMLLVGSSRLYAFTAGGEYAMCLNRPPDGRAAMVHIPSFLSIKDVIAKL